MCYLRTGAPLARWQRLRRVDKRCVREPLRTNAREKAPSGVKVETGAGNAEAQYSGAPWRKTVTMRCLGEGRVKRNRVLYSR